MVKRAPTRHRVVAVAALAAMAIGGTAIPSVGADQPSGLATPEERGPNAVTGAALPTVQIDDGVVWDQAVVGNTVFAGGQFKQTRPAGVEPGEGPLTPRSNLLAYDITTGELLPFAPQVNGVVKAVEASPDGTRLYVGGTFTTVNGQQRWNVAAFDIATGDLLEDFAPAVGGSFVNAMTVSNDTVYLGGLFSHVNGVQRTNLGAVDLSGSLTGWAPTTDLQVDDLLMAPSGERVIVAGRFGTVNGAHSPGTAAVDPATGTSLPWMLSQDKTNGVINGGISKGVNGAGTMGLSTDGVNVYGASWNYAAERLSNLEGLWAANIETGERVWVMTGKGDHYDAHAMGGMIYGVGHAHEAKGYGGWPVDAKTPRGPSYQYAVALTPEVRGTSGPGSYWDRKGQPTPALVQWYPDFTSGKFTGMGQAGWTAEGNDDYLVIGGEFQAVNGQAQYGLVRFGTDAVTPPERAAAQQMGPQLDAAQGWAPTRAETRRDGAEISIVPNLDWDDRELTYLLFREGTEEPVARAVHGADPWRRTESTVTLRDQSAEPDTLYAYVVRAMDRNGNFADSAPIDGLTGPIRGQLATEYSSAVLTAGPQTYWRLGTPVESAAIDWIGDNDGVIAEGVQTVPDGAIAGDAGGALTFAGGEDGIVASKTSSVPSSHMTQELWFRTTSTEGGLLMRHTSGTEEDAGRLVLSMDGAGLLTHSVLADGGRTLTTSTPLNDGAWHHVAVTTGTDGHRVFVDGVLAAEDAAPVDASKVEGTWRVASGLPADEQVETEDAEEGTVEATPEADAATPTPAATAPTEEGAEAGAPGADGEPATPVEPAPAASTATGFVVDLDEVAIYAKTLTADEVAEHHRIGFGTPPAPEPAPEPVPEPGTGTGNETPGGGQTGGVATGQGGAAGNDQGAEAAAGAGGAAGAGTGANAGSGAGESRATTTTPAKGDAAPGKSGASDRLPVTGALVFPIAGVAAALMAAGIWLLVSKRRGTRES